MKFKTIVLVDYENIKAHIQCELMPKHTKFIILGGRLSSLPFEMLHETLRYPTQLKWIKTEGSGHNNLDFHLAYFLGRCHMEYEKSVKLVVLSSDKGFDNLIRFINLEGRNCERVSDINLLKKKKYRTESVKLPVKAAIPAKLPLKAALKEATTSKTAVPPMPKALAEPIAAPATTVAVSPTDTLPDYARRIRTIFARRHGNPKTLSKLKNTIQRLLRFSETDPRTDEIIGLLVQDSYLLVQGQMVTYVSSSRVIRQREEPALPKEANEKEEPAAPEDLANELVAADVADESIESTEPEVTAPVAAEVQAAPEATVPAEVPVQPASAPKGKSRSGQKAAKAPTNTEKPANKPKAASDTKAKTPGQKAPTSTRVPRQPVLTQAQVDSFVAEQKEVPTPQPTSVASEAALEAAFVEQPIATQATESKPVLSIAESAQSKEANTEEGAAEVPATAVKAKRSARSYRKPRKPAGQ